MINVSYIHCVITVFRVGIVIYSYIYIYIKNIYMSIYIYSYIYIKINGTLNIEKNYSTQLFFVSGHFFEGGDFLDEVVRNILSPRRMHFVLP